MITRYDDFEVVITQQEGQLYANLGTAPGGRNLAHPIAITLPADDHVAWTEAKQGRKSEAELVELGHRLFDTLIKDELAEHWHACLGEMRLQPDTGLRLRFSLQSEALTEAPLELLCWRTHPTPKFLALDLSTPVVRSPCQGIAARKRSMTLPLKMLVIVASPKREVHIDPAAVRDCLEKALAELLQAGLLKVDYLGTEDRPGADYDTLHRTLAQAKPPYDVVHFVCHGAMPDLHDKESEGVLLLVNPQTGLGSRVRASDLASILAPNGVRVVMLQACEGASSTTHNAFQGVAQRLIAEALPAAVAMQCEVDEDVAACFCGQLYQFWLSESGLPLERAVTEARHAVRHRFPDRPSAWWTPVLFIRMESTDVLNVRLGEPPPLVRQENAVGFGDGQAYLDSLTRLPDYARWADRPRTREKEEDHYIRTESKILPLLASPFDDDTGQQREDLLETIRTHDRLLVLGEPGMGKTAALERMVWETASARGKDLVVPIYVPLSYYTGNLLAEICSALTGTGELHFSGAEDKNLDTFLRQSQCLILFDGLNEVRRDQRWQIARDITDFMRTYRRHRYVVSSRSQDLLWQTLREGNIIRDAVIVQPITDDQVREYLITHLGSQRGKETYSSLNECLRGMAHTPLFLWMLKEVVSPRKRQREVPGNRGELFDQYVEMVFTRDESTFDLSVPRPAKKQALAHLALTLQQDHRVACPEEEVVAIVSGAGVGYDAQTIMDEAQTHGLLKGKGQVRFMHQAVQEYFVAFALREMVATEVKVPTWQQLGRHVLKRGLAVYAEDPWWAESFVQLAGLTGYPSWLVREVARVNPWLAFWCMIEGKEKEIGEQVRRDVESNTVDFLRSDDFKKRQRAVQELEKLENPRTAEYLVTVLGDSTEAVVKAAVLGLGRLGEPAVEYLRPSLERDEGVRQAATRAFGLIWQLPALADLGEANTGLRLAALKTLERLKDRRTVEAIVAVARWDTEMAVRQRAVEVLGQLGDGRAVSPLLAILDHELPLRAVAAEALGQIGDERAVKPLVGILGDGDGVVRRRAVSALGAIWGLPHLTRLGDDDVAARLNAAAALGQLGDKRAVQPLMAALRDEGGAVCANAATALGQLGATQAVEPLTRVVLTRDEPIARINAAEALGKLGDRQAVESLIAALKDPERDVRRNAAMSLGRLRDERATEPLIAACKDRYVQRWAVEALTRIGRSALRSLIATLRSGESDVRASAAVALGRIGGVQALEALLSARRDDDGIVRASIAVALGNIRDAKATEALIVALREDKDTRVRASAAMSLGQVGGAQAVEALTAALENRGENEAVWRMAINALGRIWNLRDLVRLSDRDAVVRQGAAVVLGQLGDPRAVEPLLAALKDRDEVVRRRATGALGQIWELSQLVQLGDDTVTVRQGAVTDLGQLGDGRVIEPLIAALQDSSPAVRLAAAKALGQLEGERAVQPLIEALEDDDKDVRREVANALQALAPWAISRLTVALRDSNYWFRRRRVAETLGHIGEPGPLIEALRHDDKYVRRQATEALARLGDPQAVEPLIRVLRDEDYDVRRVAAEALGKIGDAGAVESLSTVLREDQDWLVRLVAAEAMGNIGAPSAVDSLVSALRDSEWPVRWMAAKALGKIKDPQAVKPLIEALQSGWPARWTAAEALGRLERVGEDERSNAVGALVATLRDGDSDKYVQQAAEEALGKIGEPIQQPLLDVLRDGDEEARRRAIAVLARLEDVRNLQPLIDALGGDTWSVRDGALEALVRIGKTAVEPLIGALNHENMFIRRRAAMALGQIGDTRAMRPLIAALQDPYSIVHQEAAQALRRLDTPEARAAVRNYKKPASEG